MDKRARNRIGLGVFLILLGILFFVQQFIPGLQELIDWSWPMVIISVGVLLLFFGIVNGSPGLAVPAAIVGGIGGLLYWQYLTGNWDSWAYAWTLIPGFVGLGVILQGLLAGRARQGVSGGGGLLLISLALFTIFASAFGSSQIAALLGPVLLILLGLWILIRRLMGKSK